MRRKSVRALKAGGLVLLAGCCWALPGPLAHRTGCSAAERELGAPNPVECDCVPGRVIVKFRGLAADALREARLAGVPLHEVPLSPEVDRLKGAYGVTKIEPVFSDFEVRDESGNVVRIETMREHVERVAARLGRQAPTRERLALLPDLTRTYAVWFAEHTDVTRAAAEFSVCTGVPAVIDVLQR